MSVKYSLECALMDIVLILRDPSNANAPVGCLWMQLDGDVLVSPTTFRPQSSLSSSVLPCTDRSSFSPGSFLFLAWK